MVNDPNLLINGTKFVKIYFNSILPDIINSIKNILINQIEHKGIKDADGVYFSKGPGELLNLICMHFDIIKNYKHKIIFNLFLKILRMSIYEYCNGINCVLSNRGIIIEDEYLITVFNDCISLYQKLAEFIEQLKNINILKLEEINETIQMEKLIELIDQLSFNAIIHLIYEHKDTLEKKADKQKFLNIDLKELLDISDKIYAKYKSMMNGRIRKIFYQEVQLTLCYYISRLLNFEMKKKKKKEDIINKIEKDKNILDDKYKDIIGENLTKITLKILDDIKSMLDINIDFYINNN